MLNKNTYQLESQLLARLKKDCHQSYSILFSAYYKNLVLFAGTIVQDKTICEDIVQNIFLKLWNDRNELNIETSLKSYLLRSVRNSCLDHLRHKKIVDSYATKLFSSFNDFDSAEDYVLYSDLHQHLVEAISKLPEKQREAFTMSRYKEMKYKEIAEKLNISERAVEDRISKALAQLRISLKDFLIILFLLLLYF
ncbi:RNA polymerase sigma-70 factor [Dysgonomonas sp. Marseille-P4677]|uniref:RNA polymerase sigma-70 factor n=1 Tax=Dysgonomonas sp. Marseille-P4677 TaxID=2364790 RepID=UPI001912B37F|nr:RNA polymerase sigma-70 factor [Dysgonomonas sp. Marseille-P4677]MBK5722509.1 RNA polymerase sigma-70 factor [Dysgonomonas sp. Marseille-P4677]